MGLSGYYAKVCVHWEGRKLSEETEEMHSFQDPALSSAKPLPVDKLIKASWIARVAHESIEGIKIVETDSSVTLKMKLQLFGLPNLYSEPYHKVCCLAPYKVPSL